MKPSPSELEADGWAFALDVYARPGIADGCLSLQNEAGVDVMMLLVIAFAAARLRILLTFAEVGELDQACRPWREQIVWPLRAIRSGLKSGPTPAPSTDTEQFRSKIKTVELAAERLQTRLLIERLPQRPPKPDAVTAEELRTILGCVVSLFIDKRGKTPDAELFPSIDKIVDAVMQEVR
jgi:uncharacterized protein (TIGR02444 family)